MTSFMLSPSHKLLVDTHVGDELRHKCGMQAWLLFIGWHSSVPILSPW